MTYRVWRVGGIAATVMGADAITALIVPQVPWLHFGFGIGTGILGAWAVRAGFPTPWQLRHPGRAWWMWRTGQRVVAAYERELAEAAETLRREIAKAAQPKERPRYRVGLPLPDLTMRMPLALEAPYVTHGEWAWCEMRAEVLTRRALAHESYAPIQCPECLWDAFVHPVTGVATCLHHMPVYSWSVPVDIATGLPQLPPEWIDSADDAGRLPPSRAHPEILRH